MKRKLLTFFNGRFHSTQNKTEATADAIRWAGYTLAHLERPIRAYTERGYICLMRPIEDGGYRYWFQTPDGTERAVCYCSCGPQFSVKTEADLWAQTVRFFKTWLADELGERTPEQIPSSFAAI